MTQTIQQANPADEAPGSYNPRMRTPRRSMCEKSRFYATDREPGYESLACAIIEAAIVDYFTLVRRGVVRRGEIIIKQWSEIIQRDNQTHYKYSVKGMTRNDAVELIRFLKSAGEFAESIELQRDWSDLWSQVLRLETTGNYRGFLNKKESEVMQ
jgi:hypothetical protein